MGKRFIDTELWERNWFLDLTPDERQAFIFIFCRCDCIGVYRYNRMHQIVFNGVKIEELITKVNKHLEKLDTDKYWLPEFCYFQYGKLTEECRPHKKYIDELKKQGLFKRVSKGYTKGIQRVQEKEEDKEQDKDMEKDKEKDSAELIYKEYPRKEGKGNAISAINKALKLIDFDYLLIAVKEYAEANKGNDKKFTPHPATWFNQERYNDDRAMWSAWKSTGQNGGVKPAYGLDDGKGVVMPQSMIDQLETSK